MIRHPTKFEVVRVADAKEVDTPGSRYQRPWEWGRRKHQFIRGSTWKMLVGEVDIQGHMFREGTRDRTGGPQKHHSRWESRRKFGLSLPSDLNTCQYSRLHLLFAVSGLGPKLVCSSKLNEDATKYEKPLPSSEVGSLRGLSTHFLTKILPAQLPPRSKLQHVQGKKNGAPQTCRKLWMGHNSSPGAEVKG